MKEMRPELWNFKLRVWTAFDWLQRHCFPESAATVIEEFNEFNAAVPWLHLTVNNRLIQNRSGLFDLWFLKLKK